MESTQVSAALAPGVAIVISLATFVFTQIRTQKLDERSAAKETVEVIAQLNKALALEVASLREKLKEIEHDRAECERQRVALLEQLAGLRKGYS